MHCGNVKKHVNDNTSARRALTALAQFFLKKIKINTRQICGGRSERVRVQFIDLQTA
jgi:hypothetical protein